MNFLDFIVIMFVIITVFILGLTYIAGKYNLLGTEKKGNDKNGTKRK